MFSKGSRNKCFVSYLGAKGAGEYNLTFAPPLPLKGGGERNKKSEIREENSKLLRKRRDKKGGDEKN